MANSRRGAIREWFSRNQREIIHCPYQPGDLKISKGACKKRHTLGQKIKRLGRASLETPYRRGLSLCGRCPIGRELTISPAAS